MKNIFTLLVLCCIVITASAQKTLSDYSELEIITKKKINLSQYYGKKVMIVNTASFCGYTPEFQPLEQLYKDYHQYNFEIIGFPCNDFGAQDPFDDSTIYAFATTNFGVTFKMMSKIATVSKDTASVYKWLQRKNLNGVSNAHVTWNFCKFLIDEAGHWVHFYDSPTSPDDIAITNWIKSPSVLTGTPTLTPDNMIQLVNPSGSSVDLLVKTASPEHFKIDVYSVEGRFVNTLYDGIADDYQAINFNYSALTSGIYFIKVQCNGAQKTIKYAVVN